MKLDNLSWHISNRVTLLGVESGSAVEAATSGIGSTSRKSALFSAACSNCQAHSKLERREHYSKGRFLLAAFNVHQSPLGY
jgi:hypothetical protein